MMFCEKSYLAADIAPLFELHSKLFDKLLKLSTNCYLDRIDRIFRIFPFLLLSNRQIQGILLILSTFNRRFNTAYCFAAR